MVLITIALTLALVMTQVLSGTAPVTDGQAVRETPATPTEQVPPARCGIETPQVEDDVSDVIWTSTEGSDGVRIDYPMMGWTWTEGSDGRRVVLPTSGWTWTEGSDGRRLIMPLTGWTWTEGEDGRRVVMPLTGWTWTEGADGRRVVHPLTGWSWQESPDGRRFVYPIHAPTRQHHIPYLLYDALEITPEWAPYRELIMLQMGLFDWD